MQKIVFSIGYKICFVVFALFMLCGCMAFTYTISDPDPKEKNLIYMGTRKSIHHIIYESNIHATPMVICDFPFTLFYDTILLPYSIGKTLDIYGKTPFEPKNKVPIDSIDVQKSK